MYSNSNNIITTEWGRYCPNDNLTIYASKLAGCVGMHMYQPQSEFKSEFMRAIGQDQDDEPYFTNDELAKQELKELSLETQTKISKATEATYSNATDVVEAFTKLTEHTDISTNVIENIRKSMYTKHGTEQESTIRQSFSKSIGKTVKTSNKFIANKEPLITVNGIEVYIGGKHDGMVDGKIVEIKTRQKHFLGTPLYELVQIHAYMHIYETRNAILVESYNGQEKRHEIIFDDGLWAKVKSELFTFLSDMIW